MPDNHLSYFLTALKKLEIRSKAGLSVLTLFLLAGWWLSGPIAQDPAYHEFADHRTLLGISNSLNVVTNILFCVSGLLGLVILHRIRYAKLPEFKIYLLFNLSVFALGPGSAYYHLDPNDATLVWDRLPLSVAFMSFLSLVIAQRVNLELGQKLFSWLVIAGPCSVIYWHWIGDLRPYILLQYGSLLILPFILWFYRGSYSGAYWIAISSYAVAKVFEYLDEQIYQFSDGLISGHSLKHIAGWLTTSMVLVILCQVGRARRDQSGAKDRIISA